MVKKCSILLTLALLVHVTSLLGTNVSAEEKQLDLSPEARSAILMDMDTGTVLYEKESDKQLPPASITKIMTMLLIMEAIDSGKISWKDKVRTSERAASMGGSQIFLEEGEEMTVEDMLKGIAIASGNDATVAMAEHIAGTEDQFVQLMNDKAKELGMKNTHFSNTNGLPTANHYTSARDIAIMSRELLKHEEITKYTSIYEDYLRKDSDKPFWLVNTNRLVKFYEGVDGLKTGYTRESKYSLAASAKRGNMRVIAVVLGTSTPKERNRNITNMLNYAFTQYESHPIYKKGDLLEEIKVDKGKAARIQMIVPHQISVLTKKGESVDLYKPTIHYASNLQAPIAKGDVIGQVRIQKDGNVVSEIDIVATVDVPRASFWTMFKRTTRTLFGFSTDSDTLIQE